MERLGPFELRRRLGQGTSGIVFEAWEPGLARAVALKVVPAKGRVPNELERFRREARTLAALSHPHIVSVHAFGETPEVLYLAMELVPGRSLDAIVAEGPLAAREAAGLVAKVARALQAAHDAG